MSVVGSRWGHGEKGEERVWKVVESAPQVPNTWCWSGACCPAYCPIPPLVSLAFPLFFACPLGAFINSPNRLVHGSAFRFFLGFSGLALAPGGLLIAYPYLEKGIGHILGQGLLPRFRVKSKFQAKFPRASWAWKNIEPGRKM